MTLNKYHVPYDKLFTANGENFLEEINSPDKYYGKFKKFLDSGSRTEMKKILKSFDIVISGTLYRASVIKAMNDTGKSYLESVKLSEHYIKDISSIDEAIDLVLDNYYDLYKRNIQLTIDCKIDGYGNIIIYEGVHRAIINLCNGADSNMCEIIERDESWEDVHRLIQSDGLQLYNNINAIYQRILHPDFQQYRPLRDDRYFSILKSISSTDLKEGLDLGCQFAQNSLYLCENGIKMTAFEYEDKYFNVAKTLGAHNKNFKIIKNNVYNVDFSLYSRDCFVIITSLLYHLIRNDEKSAILFLERLKSYFNFFIIDSENDTKILSDTKLIELMDGFQYEIIFNGTDQRNLFAFKKI